MQRHIMVVLTNPVDGKDDEFNDWYDNYHVADTLDAEGFKSAERFELISRGTYHTFNGDRDVPVPWKYLALYDIESDDIEKTLKEFIEDEPRRRGRPHDEAMDRTRMAAMVFTSRNRIFTEDD